MRNLLFLILSVFLITTPFTAEAQDKDNFSFGIGIASNVPEQPIGLEVRGVDYKSVSYFLQGKVGSPVPSAKTYEDISQDTFNDAQIDSKNQKISVSAGLTYGVTRTFHLWGGLGFTSETHYIKLQDPYDILGSSDGEYWVNGSDGTTTKLKVVGGVGMTFGQNWYALIGGEYNPVGVNLGVGLRF